MNHAQETDHGGVLGRKTFSSQMLHLNHVDLTPIKLDDCFPTPDIL